MTDAREIIRIAAEDKMKFDGFSSYDEMAEHLIDALTAAGFRILGPDEIDQVTVDDVAAELWKAEAEDAGAPASIANGRTRDAFDDQSDELKRRWRKFARAAIRALGRKA